MNHKEHIMKVIKLNLKLEWLDQIYVVIVMHTCIHVKETIEVTKKAGKGTAPNNRIKKVTFKNFTPFINCISRIKNTQADDAHDIDVVMPMYNLIEYTKNYSKTSGNLWRFY